MMADFHDILFPLRLAFGTTGGPGRRVDIVDLSTGRESRNARWQRARRRYDAGSGIRSIDDLYEVVAFFEARGGRLHGFRFRDPVDFQSCGPGKTPSPVDQVIGTGDGAALAFQLVKTYGDGAASTIRTINKPAPGTVSIAVDGVPVAGGVASVDETNGRVTFSPGNAPASAAVVTAGYVFDVPVRFDLERIEINLTAFRAGQIPTIPLMEIHP